MSKITVIGSISTDFVVTADKRPEVGETITGKEFNTTFGGKGANQAVASARLGGDVYMAGTVGTDIFATELLANLSCRLCGTRYTCSIWISSYHDR